MQRSEVAARGLAPRRERQHIAQRRIAPKSVRVARPAGNVEYDVVYEVVEYEVMRPPVVGFAHSPALGLLPLAGYLALGFR